jgi:outer membrane protein TolC
MALETSPELKMAEQDIMVAKSQYKEAKGGLLPQLDLTATAGPVEDAQVPTVVVTGSNTGYLVSHDKPWDIGVFGRLDFAITQPLYTFGKISNRKDAAALGVEARKAAREQRQNQVVLNVKELYYAYLIALQGKHAARDADSYINDAGMRIRRLIELKAKNVDASDLYRMDAFGAEVKAFAAKADSGSHTAYIALKKAIGLPEHEQFRIKETELPKNPVALEPEEEYTQRALANRPEILEVKKGVEAKGKLSDAAKSTCIPPFLPPPSDRLPAHPTAKSSIIHTYPMNSIMLTLDFLPGLSGTGISVSERESSTKRGPSIRRCAILRNSPKETSPSRW